MTTYEPMVGESIEYTAGRIVGMAYTLLRPVKATFNEIELVAHPGDSAEMIVDYFYAETKRRHDEWVNSPEGQAAQKAEEERQKRLKAIRSEPLKQFSIKDAAAWQQAVKANPDFYGSGVIRFVARWANLMEQKMAEGAKLEDIASQASAEADAEGITGFMYGCAVSILSQVWVHGEELRRWHNHDTQLGSEGDRANEEGGVLNPALLNIG